MKFHPTFKAEKEQRMIFMSPPIAPPAGPGEGEAAAPPSAELTPEQKKIQDQINQIREGNPAAVKELADFQVRKVDEDNARLQERYKTALVNAANAYHQELLKIPGGDYLKTVNDAFAPSGVTFELGADGKLKIAAEAIDVGEGEKEPEAEAGRPLTETEKDFIKNAFPNPDQAAVAERVMSRMAEGSPELKVAEQLYETFNGLDPKERQAVLTNPQAREKFRNALPADQRQFMDKLTQDLTTASKELSEEERGDIIEGAEKELEKFDATKASEIDKNIMLARMQMRGLDTSNPDGIFKKPPELKVFEGSPMERGFNQIMGLIGYVLMSIQKMKDSMKPGEKKGPDTPETADKKGPEAATGAPGEPELKKQVKEKDMLQVRRERQNEIDQNNKLLDGDPSAADGSKEKLGLRGREVALKTKDAGLQAKSEQLQAQLKTINKESSPADYAAKEREISDNEAERKKIAPELEEIQKQKAAIEARNAQLTTETKSLEDIQKRTEALRQKITDTQIEMKGALAAPPIAERAEAKAILAALNGFKITLNPAQADDHFTIELGGNPGPLVDMALFNAGADAVKKLGGNSVAWDMEAGKTLKDPEAFDASLRKALDTLKTKPAPAAPAA